MNDAESQEFDAVEKEVGSIDADIARLTRLEAVAGQLAKSVEDQAKTVASAAATQARDPAQLKTVEKLEPGIAMARYAMCLTASKGDHEKAFRLAEKHYPNTEAVVKTLKAQSEGANLSQMIVMKATVAAGTTTETTWAAPLVYANTFSGDFIEYLRPRTLIG